MSTKGFTLIEMLLVLSIVCMLGALFPFVRPVSAIDLDYQCLEITQRLLAVQQCAMREKRDIFVDFLGNELLLDDKIIPLKPAVSCNGKQLHFTPTGTVSQAMTITCHDTLHSRRIIVQLGSGRLHVQS